MGLESLEAALEKAMCEAVKMMPQLQWRCQEDGMTAKKSCRPDSEWRHSKTEDMWRANGTGEGVELAKSVIAHIMTPSGPAAGHVGTGLNFCLPASQTWCDTILLCYCPVPSSWNWNICCVPLNTEVCRLSLIFFF